MLRRDFLEPRKSAVSFISFVLLLKISLTLALWALPSLLLPEKAFAWLGFPSVRPRVFIKLLGMSYLALLVGYVDGWLNLPAAYPVVAVKMGLISNGGACLVLVWFSIQGHWSNWGRLARAHMWVSTAATGLVTTMLAWSLVHKV